MNTFNNKIALVTGAGGGLGFEIASQLADLDCKIIATDVNVVLLDAVKASLRDRVALAIEADLSHAGACEEIIAACEENVGPIDILINNAGIARIGAFDKTPTSEWVKIIQINLLAAMNLTHLVLPGMISRDWGHIGNVSSVAGLLGAPNLAAYSASKFGIRGFGEALSNDLSDHNVFVTNLYPAVTRTAILDSPTYGIGKISAPDFLIEEPRAVVKEFIKGIQNKKLHVYPGIASPFMNLVSRVLPEGPQIFSNISKLLSGN